jgi:glutamate synthase (NADPH/NADH) small chain
MEAEGIKFVTNANVGFNVKVEDLRRDFDAIVLCGGAPRRAISPCPAAISSRHPLRHGLSAAAEQAKPGRPFPRAFIDAKGKHVIILGGGDTGADCLGTALRQGAKRQAIRAAPRAPRTRSRQGHALALLADDFPHQQRPRRGRTNWPAAKSAISPSTPRPSAAKTAS